MTLKGTVLALGALLIAAPSAHADQLDLGGSDEVFALLQRPAGARALALGSGFEAVAEDPSALLWNPAAPALANGLGLSMHHENWLAGTDREVLSAQLPVNRWLGVGVHGSLIRYASTEVRDDGGEVLGDFSPQEQGFGAAVGLHLGQASLGLGGRFLNQQLPGQESSAFAGEAGLLWDVSPRLRLSSVLHAVPKEEGVYQANGSGGLSLRSAPGEWRWMLASSVRLDPVAVSEWDAGLELGYGKEVPVALRVGYSQSFPAVDAGLGQRFSLGAGAGYGFYQLDYAYLPWGTFGATHRFSLSFNQPWTQAPEADPAPAPRPVATPQPTPIVTPAPIAVTTPEPTPLPTAVAAPIPAPQSTFRVLSDAVIEARALEAAGRPSEALKLYNGAATADPNDLAAWKGMAQLYQRAGQGAYAKQCWDQVRRLDPSDLDAPR